MPSLSESVYPAITKSVRVNSSLYNKCLVRSHYCSEMNHGMMHPFHSFRKDSVLPACYFRRSTEACLHAVLSRALRQVRSPHVQPLWTRGRPWPCSGGAPGRGVLCSAAVTGLVGLSAPGAVGLGSSVSGKMAVSSYNVRRASCQAQLMSSCERVAGPE